MSRVRYEVVDDASANQRIDNYLVKILKGVPKSRVYRMLRKGEVRVFGKRVRPTYRLCLGDEVRIPPVAVSPIVANRVPADFITHLEQSVISETEEYLVLNKPTGIAVHGGSGVSIGLIEALRQQRGGFLELVHRLDRGTSGVLMIAKKRACLADLHDAFRQRATSKLYHLLVHGCFEGPGPVTCRARLQRTVTSSGERRVRIRQDGQSAHTVFSGLVQGRVVSTLRAELITGRTHQARVHARHIGFPIVGDEKYGPDNGDSEVGKAAGRLMLHAESLRVYFRGERLRFTAPVPELFQHLQTQFG